MANSNLAEYRHITIHNSGKRQSKIMGITPHYMADNGGFDTLKGCADYFAGTTRSASSNYCVGGGKVAVSVDEDYHPWTSGNWGNDETHVTIEVSNVNNTTGEISDRNYKALIALCADICQRHGITPHYDKSAGVNSTITIHRDVSTIGSTSCPGTWLYNKIASGQFEQDIMTAMGKTYEVNAPEDARPYRIRKSYKDASTQIGAYNFLSNAKTACKTGYKVYTKSGECVYEVDSAGDAWDYGAVLKVGDTVKSKWLTVTEIDDGFMKIPALGGWIGTDEATANDAGQAYLKPCKVTHIVDDELVEVDWGYLVKAAPLAAKV